MIFVRWTKLIALRKGVVSSQSTIVYELQVVRYSIDAQITADFILTSAGMFGVSSVPVTSCLSVAASTSEGGELPSSWTSLLLLTC
jgi:hypothetical protein